MKVASRYFLKELVFPFFLALGVLSFILVSQEILHLVDLKLKYGVGLWTITKLVSYILPATFAITVPMSLLVAILLSMGRIAADSELIALKAGGVSLTKLFLPLLYVGLALSFAMVGFNEWVLPRANLAYKILFWNIVSSRSSALIQEGTYIHDFEGFIIHVGRKDKASGRLEDVTLFLPPNQQSPMQVVKASWGRVVSEPNTLRVYLELHQGYLQTLGKQDTRELTQLFFDTNVMDINLQSQLDQLRGVERRPQEMPIREILMKLKELPSDNPDRFAWAVEMHKKVAIPFACLAFALVGCPLGTFLRRGGRLLAFVAALALIFNYYLLLSLGQTYGETGRMSAWLGMWLPDLELSAIGLMLMVAVHRETAFLTNWMKAA
jgi:LPS export ABC transporter permease LptF